MPNRNIGTPSVNQFSGKSKRKSTGKRLRFEIFKRDGFTCQYCGAQPPDVVLEIDHITPVAAGGTNDPANLITACATCNAGKSDKPLGERIVRPDADLLYLETQQEILELWRYQQALEQRESAIKEVMSDLAQLWCDCSGLEWHPAEHILRSMLKKYSPDIVETVIRDVAPKVGGGYVSADGIEWVKYLWGVAKNTALEWGEGGDD